MQTTFLKKLTSPVRFFAAGTCAALVAALTLCLGAATAHGATPPKRIVVTGPATQIGVMKFTPTGGSSTGGGWDSGAAPVGGTFVIGANGNVIIGDGYGTADAFEITPSGTQTILATGGGGNSSAAAIDGYGNVYVGFEYNGNIYKIPYNSVKGAYAGYTTAPAANCLGGTQDTAACIYAPNLASLSGIAGLAFDQQGNLIVATDDNGTNKNKIYVCSAACQAETDGKGTNAPQLLYSDSNAIGAIAADPWGNIFFSDGASGSSGAVSNLNEIVNASGTYSAPAVVESYTNSDGYTNGIAGVAVGADGTVYFGTNSDGIFGIPNSSSGLNLSGIYVVSSSAGAKAIAVDAHGNFAFIPYSNTLSEDVISILPTGRAPLGLTAVKSATPATISGTIYDSAAACTPTLTLTPTQFGVASTEYSVTTGSCSAAFGGSNGTLSPALPSAGAAVSATISFVPSAVGARNGLLTIADSANNAAGQIPLSGVGQGALVNVDPGNLASSVTAGLTSPVSAVVDPAGDLFVADASGKVYEMAAGGTTLTTIGSGFVTPSALAFDGNGNLYVADNGTGADDIVEIPNTGTAGAFVAGTPFTLISSTMPLAGATLKNPTGLAVGPSGSLYIADGTQARVVLFNPATGQGGLTQAVGASGLKTPQGLAVDDGGNLYVADPGAQAVFIFTSAGVESTLSGVSGVTQPVGVAVDASGSVLIADGKTGNIVRVPSISGAAPDPTKAILVETVAPSASSLAMNYSGHHIVVASQSGKAVYNIQRTAASINIGSVTDGATNTGTVYLEDAGNATATLATPSTTQPSNYPEFSLSPSSSANGCTDGGSGVAGSACTYTAEFAPPAGTATGSYSGTAQIVASTPAISTPVNITGSAAASAAQSNTITWSAGTPSAGYVGQQIALSATSTSTEPVSFASTTTSACTVSGTTATFIAASTCTIQATVPACSPNGCSVSGTLYAAASPVAVNITVTDITASSVPSLLMSQQNWLSALPAGGAFAQDSAAGTSFGVNPGGNAVLSTSYGDTVALYNPSTATWTTLGNYGKYNNTGAVALDSTGNIYVSALYSGIVAKLPYNNGKYAALTDATSGTAPANCTGSDTTECVVAPVSSVAGIGGISAMTFDAKGDLFLATDDQGNNPFAIWECTAACMASGTSGSPAPVLVYQEPTGSSGNQLYVGGLAVDPWGNLFFTDSYLLGQNTTNKNNTSQYSDLNYLPVSTGAGYNGATTGFAAAPTVLETFTDASAAGYDDEIDGVVATSGGTVYYTSQYDGILAVPNTQAGGPNIANQYWVSGQGAKEIALDANGNIYYVAYHGKGDTLGEVVVSDLQGGVAPVSGTPVTAAAMVVDNAIGCSPAATLAITSSNAEFAATAGGTCSSLAVASGNGTMSKAINAASSYGATITFAPTAAGPQTATLSVDDTTNGGTGSASVTGTGQETPQTITFTAPASAAAYTYAPGLTIPIQASSTGAASGTINAMTFALDPSSTAQGTISTPVLSNGVWSATLTVTQACNTAKATAANCTIIVDAAQAGGLVNNVYYQQTTVQSAALTINQAAQTITFTQVSPATYTYAASPSQVTLQLSATGGASGNAVEFSVDPSSTATATITASSTVGTASLATLTVTGAGSLVIDATQAANNNYATGTLQNAETLTINQAAQTITFLPPAQAIHFIAGGITVPISATGGGSNNSIVFTVDKASTMTATVGTSAVSGATSTATLTIPAQAATSGTVVLDATQASSTDYAAASSTPLVTLTIGAPLPTQTITFNNPGTQVEGTPATLSAMASSTLPVSFTSSTTSVCTVTGAVVTFATSITSASTCTIVASQPGDNVNWAAASSVTQSFTVNPKGQNPNFSLDLSLSALTIAPGTTGLTQLTITSSNSFTGALALTCSGLPAGYTCTFNPNPVTIAAGGTATTTLSVTPPATASLVRHGSRPLAPFTALAVVLCFFGFRKRSRLQLLVILALGLTALSTLTACGGSSSTIQTAATTSTATITVSASGLAGASANVQQTTTLTVTVE